MDISSPCGKSVFENVGSFGGLQSSVNQEKKLPISLADSLVTDLVNAVDESLNIKDVGKESGDVGKVEFASNEDDTSGLENRDAYKGDTAEQGKVTRKCLDKCATFPNPNGVVPPCASSDREEEEPETALRSLFGEELVRQAYSRSVSLPTPLKLLSAMKGSREKEGLSPGKLTVTWAPDVYDPPATSMSHTVTGKKQQKSKNKKNWKRDGKKGQKGNSSRGKEKKQFRKERSHRSLDGRESLVDANNQFGELVGGSQDPHSFCGSSFLKNSLSNMHYPVAEAL